MQHFSSKNYKLLLGEIKEYLNKERDTSCLCIRRLSTVKTHLLRLVRRFGAVPEHTRAEESQSFRRQTAWRSPGHRLPGLVLSRVRLTVLSGIEGVSRGGEEARSPGRARRVPKAGRAGPGGRRRFTQKCDGHYLQVSSGGIMDEYSLLLCVSIF